MLEYIFFSERIQNKFIEILNAEKLQYSCVSDPINTDARIVQIGEPENDGLWDKLDAHYDLLIQEEQKNLEKEPDNLSGAGIYIELNDGRNTLAMVDPDIVNRMLSVITMDELNDFIEIITKSIENPDNSPICQQLEKA